MALFLDYTGCLPTWKTQGNYGKLRQNYKYIDALT